jgi:hypothetical protein
MIACVGPRFRSIADKALSTIAKLSPDLRITHKELDRYAAVRIPLKNLYILQRDLQQPYAKPESLKA